MNEYLKPIFEKVISKIDSANIKYWIYGGVANAAMVGKCYRSNPDVDVFVLGDDFENVENILQNICKENGWKICKEFVNNRQKIEVSILKDNKKWIERMSLIPAYRRDNYIELRFRKGSGKYSPDILNQEKRDLGGFIFFTISDQFLKKLFVEYLDSKSKYPLKRIDDARYILSGEEFKKYFPNQSYEKS